MENKLFSNYLEMAESLGEKYAIMHCIEIEDALQEARILLFECTNTYNKEKGNFENYLRRAMAKKFSRIHFRYRGINVPEKHTNTYIKAMNIVNKNLLEDVSVLRLADNASITRTEARKVLERAKVFYAIENSGYCPEDAINLDNVLEDEVFRSNRTQMIIQIVRNFCTEKEAEVVVRFFGFCGEPTRFVDMVNDIGVCKQRVGQLYKQALKKLSSVQCKEAFMEVM